MKIKEIAEQISLIIKKSLSKEEIDQVNTILNRSDETFMCPECKEWTSEEDSCCGVGPSNREYERDYER